MKTNVNMVRKLDKFDVIQRTKDGMFNATTLVAQWNAARGERKEIKEFFRNENTKRFIDALIFEEKLNTQNSPHLESRANQGFPNRENSPHLESRANQGFPNRENSPHLESRANQGFPTEAFITTRGNKGATWMHPILFIKFAMWLNPAFEVKVIKFVYDNLIAFRHDCGDNYRTLTASVSKFIDVDYPKLAQALNYVVFGKHYSNIRNDASEAQLQELRSLEEKLAYAVDNDLITSYSSLIEMLRKNWADKWRKF